MGEDQETSSERLGEVASAKEAEEMALLRKVHSPKNDDDMSNIGSSKR